MIGREVALPSGFPDLLAVELTGRLVVIEVKLASNAESRRAVIAQALGYAAALQGMSIEELEGDVLHAELRRLGYANLAGAARSVDQEDVLDGEEFASALAENLRSGAFRIVLVLDDAPEELVRLAGFLERVTDGLRLDLVTVSAFDINGRRIMVPQRVDPLRRPTDEPARARGSRPDAVPVEGSDAFARCIAGYPPDAREANERVLAWARRLEREGVAHLWSTIGAIQHVLQVRIRGEQVGLATVWGGHKGPSLSLWETVFQRRAPGALAAIEELIAPKTMGKSVRTIDAPLLEALSEAYREAAGSS